MTNDKIVEGGKHKTEHTNHGRALKLYADPFRFRSSLLPPPRSTCKNLRPKTSSTSHGQKSLPFYRPMPIFGLYRALLSMPSCSVFDSNEYETRQRLHCSKGEDSLRLRNAAKLQNSDQYLQRSEPRSKDYTPGTARYHTHEDGL